MDPKRLGQVERLYHAALERPASERHAFLDQACRGDSALRRDVAALLAADEYAGSFLAGQALDLAAKASASGDAGEADDSQTNVPGGADDASGKTISHYLIGDVLGEGGMGVVYRAVDTRLNRVVAVKRLRAEVMADAERAKRFLQEAQAASSLNHPHIVTVYDIGSVGGVDFMAMEFVEGRTLQARLADGTGLGVREALKYGEQIADAVAAAHAAGIVHRDLKPANVMINARGDAKVLDFGLAKLTERPRNTAESWQTTQADEALRTEKGMILGTVAYMSPEQAEGRGIDARSDIFAFGALLYEMVTGRAAFHGGSRAATLAAVLREEPRPAGQIVPGIPPELDRIIARCLRKEPEGRFQHLADVRALLEALRDQAIAAQMTVADRARERIGRTRLTMRLAGPLLVVTAIATSVWWLTRGSRSASDTATTFTAAPASTAAPRLTTGGPASSNAEANRLFENAMQSSVVNDLPRARRMLERALELDPRFAEARAWHAFTDWLLLDQGYSNDSTILYKAEDEMRRAASEDPTLARAHMGLAAIYLMQGRKELIPAEAAEALKSNPGDADVSNILMQYHQYSGDYAAAQRVGQQVLDRLPLFFPNRMILGELLRQQGDVASAIREQQKILEQDPQSIYALTYLAHAYLDVGDLVRARETLNRVRADDQRSYRVRRTRALLLAREGRRADALTEMDDDVLAWLALVAWETAEAAEFYAVLQDTPKALDWLDRAVRNGDERSEWFRRDPLLANIHDHPRFGQILASITYRRQQQTTR